jgi:hypothetical protein
MIMQVVNFCGFLAAWRHFRGVAFLRLALAVALLGTLAPQAQAVLATGGTVTPTNPPIAHAQSVTTAEDTAAAITLTGAMAVLCSRASGWRVGG